MSILFKKTNNGIMDVIRCDEPSYLIWKWSPEGTLQKLSKRANEIRWGSSLRVKEGEVAVFVYSNKGDLIQDYIEGPFDQILKTENLPVLTNIIGLAYGGDSPFQAEIYFINLAEIIQIKFGIPYFDIFDPRFTDFGVPTAVRGTISFKISDYKEFIKLHRLDTFTLEDFKAQIKDAVCRYVKSVVASAPSGLNISLAQIESETNKISTKIEKELCKRLFDSFGVTVSNVDISDIEIDKSSNEYKQLMSITKDVVSTKIKAETEDYVEKIRIKREEEQYAMHKQTQSGNLGALQIEKQADIGIAGAKALGEMGTNGSGDINLGNNSTGFNPAAMMAGVALGNAVGQNISNSINSISTNNQTTQITTTPPPIPSDLYYIAMEGKAIGPYSTEKLKELAVEGKLNKDSLIWKNGMQNWQKADSIDELKSVLFEIPPIPSNI